MNALRASGSYAAVVALAALSVAGCSGAAAGPETTRQPIDSAPPRDGHTAKPTPPPEASPPRDSTSQPDHAPHASPSPSLNGVFVPTFGQPLSTEATLKTILATPSLLATIDGFYIQRPWSDLEPSDGKYDFTALDADLDAAKNAHVKVTLSVGAGSSMPAWLCASAGAGAECATFVQIPYARPGDCTSFSVPVPWDSVFQKRWAAFIAALGKHLVAYESLVAAVKVTGINSDTDETQLPHDSGGSVSCSSGPACTHGTCAVTDAPSAWSTLGYTESRVLDAWSSIQSEFATAFPKAVLDVQIVGKGFPNDPTGSVTKSIVASGLSALAGRFAVQANGLDATGGVPGDVLQAAGTGAIAGYQMLQKVEGDPHCVMAKGLPPGTPCDATVLEDAVNVGLANQASFLEIYATDVVAFPTTVECAKDELSLGVGTTRICK